MSEALPVCGSPGTPYLTVLNMWNNLGYEEFSVEKKRGTVTVCRQLRYKKPLVLFKDFKRNTLENASIKNVFIINNIFWLLFLSCLVRKVWRREPMSKSFFFVSACIQHSFSNQRVW